MDFEDYGPSDELSQQIHQMIENEARAKITSTFTELEQSRKSNEELRKQIQEMRNQIRTFDDKIKKERKAAEESVKRDFFDGYICGDRVFVADGKYTSEKCDLCEGEGKTQALINNTEMKVRCPKCDGMASNSKIHYLPFEDQISTVIVEMSHNGSKYVNAYLKKKDSKVSRERIFATLEECQAYCDEKNTAAIN